MMLSMIGKSHILRDMTQRVVELWKGTQSIELC